MTRSTTRRSRGKSCARPTFETLENRQLFSVTAGLVGGVTEVRAPVASADDVHLTTRNATFLSNGILYVNGGDNGDVLHVRYNPGPVLSPYFALPPGPGTESLGPTFEVQRGGVTTHSFSAAAVSQITIVGFGGHDVLSVDPAMTVPLRAYGC
jgi:hypothetical protein